MEQYIQTLKLNEQLPYLHYQSSQLQHIKTSIAFSQVLKVSKICSSEKDLKTHVSHMKEWLLIIK